MLCLQPSKITSGLALENSLKMLTYAVLVTLGCFLLISIRDLLLHHPLGFDLDHLADLEVAAQLVGSVKGHPALSAAVRLLGTRTGGMFRGNVSGHPFTLIDRNLELTSLHSTPVHCPPSGSLLDSTNIPEKADR